MKAPHRIALAVGLLLLAGGGRAVEAQAPEASSDVLGHPLPKGVVPRLGQRGLAVPGEVHAAAFSPDGSRLATLSQNGASMQLQLWDAKTGELRRSLPLPRPSDANWVVFSNDGKSLYTALGVVDVASGGIRGLSAPSWAVSNGGKLAAGMKDAANKLAVTRLKDGAELWSAVVGDEKSRVSAAAFSPRSDIVAASSYDGKLLIFDAVTGKQLTEPATTTKGVSQMVFSADGKRLALAGGFNSVILLNVETGAADRNLVGLTRGASAVAFSPDGRWVAAGEKYENKFTIWEAATGRVEKTHSTMVYDCHTLAFSADGARLAVGGRSSGGPNLQIYEVETGQELFVPNGPRTPLHQIAFSANSRRLATGCSDGRIHLWDTTDAKPRLELSGDSSQDLQFSPDGWTLSAAGRDGTLNVWEADTGDTLLSRSRNHAFDYTAARIAPDNDFLACATRDGKIELVKFATGEKLRSIPAYKRADSCSLAISPDGSLLAASVRSLVERGTRPSVELWNVETGKQVCTLFTDEPVDPRGFSPEAMADLRFSPAGDVIAARGRDGLYLWETDNGDQVLKVQPSGSAYCFAPNGRFLVCQKGEKLVVVELVTGRTCLELSLSETVGSQCTALAISPDGRLLAAGTTPIDGIPLLSLAPPGVDVEKPPTEEEIARAWERLVASDAGAAYEAAWTLAAADNLGVDFVRDHLAPLADTKLDSERVAKLIAELDDDHFEVRERATTALQQIGPAALPSIKQAAKQDSLTTEHKFRLERVAATMENAVRRFSGEPLRRLRAIGVLERIGTRPAGELLAKLAAGPPTARETLDAKSALVRLKQRLSGP